MGCTQIAQRKSVPLRPDFTVWHVPDAAGISMGHFILLGDLEASSTDLRILLLLPLNVG